MFNTLTEKEKIDQLNKCRFMKKDEFSDGVNELLEKNIIIVVLIDTYFEINKDKST